MASRTLLWAGHVARIPKSRLPKGLMLSWVHEPRIEGGTYVPNGLRPPFFALHYAHYRHNFVYPFFNSMPGRGSVSTVDERRQCSIIVYDDLLWNALVVERASKQ